MELNLNMVVLQLHCVGKSIILQTLTSCSPARCQLLTGLYAHNTGVYANVGDYGARRGFVEPLDEAGLFCRERRILTVRSPDERRERKMHQSRKENDCLYA